MVAEFEGVFPLKAQILVTLPGIGKSTAAAIAAFCAGERVAILDANVRRVLTRVLGFKLDLSLSANIDLLWAQAENLLPYDELMLQMPRYTQGLMDLGSAICTTRRPQCLLCPLQKWCCAYKENAVMSYPVRSKKLKRKSLQWWLLFWVRTDGAVWLERRPDEGIWAQLYAPPVGSSYEVIAQWLKPHHLGSQDDAVALLEPMVHVLTHLDIHLHPVVARVDRSAVFNGAGRWLDVNDALELGLPAPIRKLIKDVLRLHFTPSLSVQERFELPL